MLVTNATQRVHQLGGEIAVRKILKNNKKLMEEESVFENWLLALKDHSQKLSPAELQACIDLSEERSRQLTSSFRKRLYLKSCTKLTERFVCSPNVQRSSRMTCLQLEQVAIVQALSELTGGYVDIDIMHLENATHDTISDIETHRLANKVGLYVFV
jgi:hypothetical protein